MLNSKNRSVFQKKLTDWYNNYHRKLPWRETNNPYHIWVSEVMLQQTQVKTVIPYYQRFLEKFPDCRSLAHADTDTVLKMWEGLGYYSRARNFQHACREIVADYDGRVPDTFEAFVRLKGVGDYIGSAVQSIAFGREKAVVDGNVKRVLARIYKDDTPVNASFAHKKFSEIAITLLDRKDPGTFNQAMMELGALVCKPRNPLCGDCPVNEFCKSLKDGTTDRYPLRVKTKKVPEYNISAGIVVKNNSVLITKRKPEGLLGGLWEFPGGKIKKGETAENACIREILEETGLTVRVKNHLTTVRHTYTHFKIRMDVFVCDYIAGEIALSGPVDHRWIYLSEIDAYPFPKANHKFFPELKKIDLSDTR